MYNKIVKELGTILMYNNPDAAAQVRGSDSYPKINGEVLFYQIADGVIVLADITGLPDSGGEICDGRVFGFHIHEGTMCSGNGQDPFADAGMHYNPDGCEHPYHAGDMPPLFGNGGDALSVFFTDRFSVKDVIGRTVIIHDMPDDFKTQPSGDSGTKIACGQIKVA